MGGGGRPLRVKVTELQYITVEFLGQPRKKNWTATEEMTKNWNKNNFVCLFYQKCINILGAYQNYGLEVALITYKRAVTPTSLSTILDLF